MTIIIDAGKHEITVALNNKNVDLLFIYRATSRDIEITCNKVGDRSVKYNPKKYFKILDKPVIEAICTAFNSLKYYGYDFHLGSFDDVLQKWFIRNILVNTSVLDKYEIDTARQHAIDNTDKLRKSLHKTRKDKSSQYDIRDTPLKSATFYELKKEYESRQEFSTVNKVETIQEFDFTEFDIVEISLDEVQSDFEDILEKDAASEAIGPETLESSLTDDFNFDESDPENAKILSDLAAEAKSNDLPVFTMRNNIKGSALDNARGIKKN